MVGQAQRNAKRAARRAVARAPPPTYSGGCGRVQVPVQTAGLWIGSGPDRQHSLDQAVHQLAPLAEIDPERVIFDGSVAQTHRGVQPTAAHVSTSAMSSASRTGFHNGPSAQSTLAIRFEVRARNIAAAMIGLQLHPCPVAWCSSTLTEVMPGLTPLRQFECGTDKFALRAWLSLRGGEVEAQHRQQHVTPPVRLPAPPPTAGTRESRETARGRRSRCGCRTRRCSRRTAPDPAEKCQRWLRR